jgi:DNA-binding SARP family transcriptional activator
MRLGELQPYDDEVHRQVLALMLARGRRSDAVRYYAAFGERLAREFGDRPGFKLADITPTDADPG